MATTPESAPTLALVPSAEEQAIRESVRGICLGFGEDYPRRCQEAGLPPTELWEALSAGGFTGINIPTEWGGGGMGMAGLTLVAEEIAAANGMTTLMLVVSPAIAGTILALHGAPEQRERWLRGIAAGTTKLAFAITEPDAGTNSHNLRTEVRRDGGRYLLTGQKTYISGVEDADAVLVVARFRRPDGELGKPTLCIVDVDAPGFTRDPIKLPYLGPDRQWTLFFDDVEVEPERIVGGEEGGLPVTFDGLNPERVIAAAGANGLSRRALEKSCAYANERVVWSTPIGAHQAIAHPLARGKIELELARLMTRKAAALIDARAGALAGEASNMAKFAAGEAACHCVDAAIQTHGGNGVAIEYGISDLWWMARLLRIAPVSEQMILNHVAQHALGLPRSY